MPYFEHNGASLYYEVKGFSQRHPILLLHGNGESMEIFDRLTAPLLQRYAFIGLDSRGHGRSEITEPNAPRITYELMADDAAALLNHLGVNQCDVVGFSDGAILALMLAMNANGARHRIRRVVAVGANISPSGIKPHVAMAMKLERARAKAAGDSRKYELFDMMLTQPDIQADELAEIFADTAIVAGEHDIIKRSHTESIKNAIMHGRLITIAGADHFIPQKHPDKLREIMIKELE